MKSNEIFKYDDYRQYLADFLSAQKKKRETYSARYFSQVAGFSSPNYCTLIVNGKRNITLRILPKMVKALKLKGKNASYFELLVKFNQSSDDGEKELLYKKMSKIRVATGYKKVSEEQYKLFSKWYYGVVLEIASTIDWEDDYAILAQHLYPKITKKQAEEAVEVLLETKLLKRSPHGKYSMAKEYLTDVGVPTFVRSLGRKDVLNLGINACEKLTPEERYTTVSTYKMSSEGYSQLVDEFEKFSNRVEEILSADDGEQKVFELVHQLFPVSAALKK